MIGSAYLGLVAALPCAICRARPVEVHHRRAGTGGGRRASDFATIPLCVEHHRGAAGVHGLGSKAFAREYSVTEAELVAMTQGLLDVSVEDVARWEAEAADRALAASARKAEALRGPKPLRPAQPVKPQARSAWPRRALQSRSSFASRWGRQ